MFSKKLGLLPSKILTSVFNESSKILYGLNTTLLSLPHHHTLPYFKLSSTYSVMADLTLMRAESTQFSVEMSQCLTV